MLVNASVKIVLPVRQFEIDRADGDQFIVNAAGIRQSQVHTGDIAVQNAFKAARPRLRDSKRPQLPQQRIVFVERQAPKGPAEETDVGVDAAETWLDFVR